MHSTTVADGEYKYKNTILHQASQQARLGHNAATLVEIGAVLELGIAGHLSFKNVSNHFGINVAQVRSKFLDVDLDILTCNSSVGVNKLLSDLSPAAQAQCSVVDAIVTVPKTEILCAFSKCIEIEGSASFKFGTVKISHGETDQLKVGVEPGVSKKGQLHMKIVDKPRKKP
jgi:hypothetical protein